MITVFILGIGSMIVFLLFLKDIKDILSKFLNRNNELQNYINNEWCDAESGGTFDVINPYTEKGSQVPASDEKTEKAVVAAQMRFKIGGK